MKYYDTRTPYVNAYYAQGRADAAQLRVDVSQNVNPLLNFGLLYYRRQGNGVYSNFVTDHNTLGATSNFHTLNERYQVYVHYLFQIHNDNIHGGVEELTPDSVLFAQGTQPVSLEEATLRRLSRAGAMRQFYRLTKDTVDAKHSFWLYNGASAEFFLNQYTDGGIDSLVNFTLFPPYPTLGDSSFFYERLITRSTKVDAGITYKFNKPNFKSRQRLEIAQDFIVLNKNHHDTTLSRSSAMWKGNILIDPNPFAIEGNWTYRQTVSNLFKPETYLNLEAAIEFPKWKLDYSRRVAGPPLRPEDSVTVMKTHRPFRIEVQSLVYDRNPSLQQTYGSGWSGNQMVADSSLRNRRTEHFRLGVRWSGESKWTKSGESQGRYIQISAFNTRNFGHVFLGDASGFVQTPVQQYLQYTGLELKLRANLGKWYLETTTVGQNFNSNNDTLKTLFEDWQPRAYTKASLYYENRELKFANMLRFGVDFWYSLDYNAPFFDPAAQTFYPQLFYTQKAYPRLDFVAATQVKKAYIYLRVLNTLEGVQVPGYFSTFGYPMAVRQVMLGLNWSFFD